MMQDFHQIRAWQKAHAFVLRIYNVSGQFPASENFGLTANLRRSAIAIPRAIAEGSVRATGQEFGVDLKKARAAAAEAEYLLLLCHDLELLPEATYEETLAQLHETSKMISGLLRSVVAEPVRKE